MKYILAFCVAACVVLLITHRMDQRYAEGVAHGKRVALNTNPVSDELEMVCAGLWVGEQNKKAMLNESK
jgi:hypothetical protein